MNTLRNTTFILALACLLVTGFGFISKAEAGGPPPVVIMETSMGRIIVMLTPKETPKTVANFLKYVDAGFYNNTMFHRIVAMEEKKGQAIATSTDINIVQGGGFTYPLKMKPSIYPPVVNEDFRALPNKRGTIAMARRGDPNSATSQFFFNVKDNLLLDPRVDKKKWSQDPKELQASHGYCVFGKVIRGMDVIDKMLAVKTGRVRQFQNVPVKPIILKKVYRSQ